MRTLQQMLEGMDEAEFREKAKTDLPFFCERVLGLELSTFHLDQLKLLDKRYVCIVSPRGHLKTTLFAIAYPIWRMWSENNREICLISSALDQSKKTLEKVQAMIEDNELLKELIPIARESPWNKLLLTCRNGSRYFIKPFNSTVRGTHVDYCVCDDILREGNRQDQIRETFWSVVFPIVQTKRGQLIVIGTPMAENDLLSEIGKKHGWTSRRWSAIEEGEPLWPERFTLDELESIRDAQGDFKFNTEYLCDIKESFRKARALFVGRKKELDQILKSVKKGKNVLITGSPGIGKTSLLLKAREEIENNVYYGPGSGKLSKLVCSKAGIPTKGRYETVVLAGMLKARENKIVLLLDDVDEVTGSVAREIAGLADGLTIVATGMTEPIHERLSWLFKEKINLRPFNMDETADLMVKKLKTLPDARCIRKIFWMTKGIPLAVDDFSSDLARMISDGETVEKAVDGIKIHPCVCAASKDVFPVVGIITIAYMLLALRYVARAGDNTWLYLFSGTLGFFLLALIRSLMYRRRRNQK